MSVDNLLPFRALAEIEDEDSDDITTLKHVRPAAEKRAADEIANRESCRDFDRFAMMRHSRLMAGVETIPQLDVQERVFNKLARTFAAQMEALRKYRHGGEQKVTVQHVQVSDGGQAIVGNVSRGWGQVKKCQTTPCTPVSAALAVQPDPSDPGYPAKPQPFEVGPFSACMARAEAHQWERRTGTTDMGPTRWKRNWSP